MIDKLRTHLDSADIPEPKDNAEGLANKIHEKLRMLANGQWTEAELDSFIAEKIDATAANLEQLETQPYPDIAAEKHAVLHSAFVAYEEALLSLEQFLWGEFEPEETLADILRHFEHGDLRLATFLSELEKDLATLKSFNAVW